MSRIRTALVAFLAIALLAMTAQAALADNLIVTDLTIDKPNIEVVDVDQVTNVSYYLQANSGDAGTEAPNGCNASDGSPAIVSINVPSGVTMVSPSNPFSLSNCGQANGKVAQFKSSTPGDYPITAVVSDSGSTSAGAYNENPAKFTLRVVAPVVDPEPVDSTPPVIHAPDMVVEGNARNGANVPAYDVTVTDDTDQTPTVTFNPVPGFFALGTHTVTVNAEDDAHNQSSATFTLTVEDNTPPVIAALSDITKYGWNGFFQPVDNGDVVNKAKAGQSIPMKFNLDGPANVNYSASATDIVDGNVTVTCSVPSGGSFPQGTTTVTCTATDHSGNSASDSFDVTVVGGNLGLNIMSPTSGIVWGPVPPADAIDDVEVYSTSVPGLNYDAVAKQYIYVWKTDKAWAGKSGTFKLQLADGSVHTALFNFTK